MGTSEAFNSSPATSARYCYIITDTAKGTRVFLTGADYDVEVQNLPATDGGGNQTFVSTGIAHQGLRRSQEFDEQKTTVMMPKNDGNLAPFFLSSITAELRIKILRISSYANDPQVLEYGIDTKTITEGVVNNIAFSDSMASAEVIPEAYAQNFSVPRFWFTRTCNHALYTPSCGVDPEAHKWDTTVVSINRELRTIEVAGRPNPADHWFFGTISHDLSQVKVSIVAASNAGASNTAFVTNNWLPTMKVGDGVRVLPGCRRIPADCRDKFGNAANFGGFHKVPTRDIVQHGV